jgi:hypothetical protein
LRLDGEKAEPPKFVWGADIFPGNFAVPAMASFLSGPKEGPATFVNSLNDSSRKESGGHSMGEHGREDRVNENQAPSDREAPAPPPR